MKHGLWLSLITRLACCIDKELYKAIDYLREQVRVLVDHQEKENKRILLTNNQRMRVASKAKRLSRKMLEQVVDLIIRFKQENPLSRTDACEEFLYPTGNDATTASHQEVNGTV